ncbi:AfsR/SARP family transcriptional regulator [Nonomuraea sp. NPDC049646]|uniref:AfsR/SARP family transcriptional regulator n=1 Tax=unclassified Nonomuraea TaxID=2593643 RepID=UPI003791114B
MAAAWFGMLGPMDVRVAGRPLALHGPRQERTLAALLLDADRVVTVDRLVDVVWEEPPASARRQIQDLVTRLRRTLADAGAAPGVITTQRAGYLLRPGERGLDARAFESLTAAARQTARTDPAGAVAGYREALSLWRGPFLAGVRGRAFEGAARIWQERRLAAVEECLALELSLGRHHEVTAEALTLVEQHPVRESLVELLMRALHGAGRLADALDAYRALRRRLADELGLDPGAGLRRLHDTLLRSQTVASGPASAPASASGSASGSASEPASGHVAAMLPPGVYGFVGRAAELARLDALLAAAGEQPAAVVVAAVTGTAGVGKTALAVHWAHRVRDRFPDGQLYVNLRGFDQSGRPMTPVEAMRVFGDALGAPANRVPASPEAWTGLYRSLLAGRRMLIVLDNARDAEQVRPLLPGAPGCLVLVTSRDQLSGLVAAEGAHPLRLDLLSVPEARELLARRLGGERVAAEPGAAAEIIERCARLPLALAVIAARAATHPGFPLAVIADELPPVHCDHAPHAGHAGHAEHAGQYGGPAAGLYANLDAFDADGPGTQLRLVFSWSHQGLSGGAGRLFRLLGLHPGPDLSLPAAAGLAGLPAARARALLGELCRAHLLSQHVPGRYTFHDLLRAHAVELVQELTPEAERRAATRRLLDHYLHTARTAATLLNPHRDPLPAPPPTPQTTHEKPPSGGGTTYHEPPSGGGAVFEESAGGALAWFTAECAVLVAAVARAAALGFDAHAWQLAWTLADFLDRRGMRHEHLAVQTTALAAARHAGDRLGQACVHGNLGWANTAIDRFDDARAHFRLALDLYGELGDPTGQARVHGNLSTMYSIQGRHQDALHHVTQALTLYRAAGHLTGQARALNAVGWFHAQLGDQEQALAHCRQALDLHRRLGDVLGQANSCDSLGYACHLLGRHEEAVSWYERAVELFREAGDRYHQADTLTRLGDTLHAAALPDAAADTWRQALTLLEALAHPSAAEVRTRLTG